MIVDFHFHSWYSEDCRRNRDPVGYVEAGIEKGASILCFADHVDIDFPERNITFDTADYTACMHGLREKYKDKIDIRMGVEVGMQPHIAKECDDFVKSAPFDFVICSTHLIQKLRPSIRLYKEFLERFPEEHEGTEAYLLDTLANIKAFDNFDVYGHLDGHTRSCYGVQFSYRDHADLMDEILKTLLEKGKGIELNSGGFGYWGYGSPCPDVLKRYRELGGEIITLGSDAHAPDDLCAHMQRAKAELVARGFEYFTVFKDRKPEFIKLT